MNTNPKRYDLEQVGDHQREGVMKEVANGDWVSSDDYDDLETECRRLRAIINRAAECLNEI